ncbi:uncharacterized protein MYCFIDRAFT_177985 [Pseudocercospora fijiensis CIRAD86]|uniref:Uncharacterized protein n=1 Tax=Pseudocercospora fijiensis (strain CIRAD86) TaxID=383855 RepID=M2ZJV1_PSEFD|nr:uncharacterized protein MYCFIDRAFT_177985 [Pseudocercospora fijiensis CIRAD86]EME79384.1 hypothetical protein MYCFIDRAFT_177985 [Pseudocercospora fijiensis CIRAD86]
MINVGVATSSRSASRSLGMQGSHHLTTSYLHRQFFENAATELVDESKKESYRPRSIYDDVPPAPLQVLSKNNHGPSLLTHQSTHTAAIAINLRRRIRPALAQVRKLRTTSMSHALTCSDMISPQRPCMTNGHAIRLTSNRMPDCSELHRVSELVRYVCLQWISILPTCTCCNGQHHFTTSTNRNRSATEQQFGRRSKEGRTLKMPPKGSTKAKAEDKPPATPEKPKAKAETATPSKTPTKTPTKRATSQSVEFKSLPKDTAGPLVPIDVSYEGNNPQAILRTKGIPYGKILKLTAENAFTLEKSVMLTDGEYAGHQAIIVRPAKPFDFMSISVEARNLVYRYYFAAKALVNGSIIIDGKRQTTKEPFAKAFADGSKQRSHPFAHHTTPNPLTPHRSTRKPSKSSTPAPSASTQPKQPHLRNTVTNIEIKTYQKTSARNALHYLSEVTTLTRLHFETGVFAEGDPIKAAKAFWNDGYKFLQAVVNRREDKDKTKAVDVLSFHKNAFLLKDDSKKDAKATKPWPETMFVPPTPSLSLLHLLIEIDTHSQNQFSSSLDVHLWGDGCHELQAEAKGYGELGAFAAWRGGDVCCASDG